jgi:hypothetical protein
MPIVRLPLPDLELHRDPHATETLGEPRRIVQQDLRIAHMDQRGGEPGEIGADGGEERRLERQRRREITEAQREAGREL